MVVGGGQVREVVVPVPLRDYSDDGPLGGQAGVEEQEEQEHGEAAFCCVHKSKIRFYNWCT